MGSTGEAGSRPVPVSFRRATQWDLPSSSSIALNAGRASARAYSYLLEALIAYYYCLVAGFTARVGCQRFDPGRDALVLVPGHRRQAKLIR